MEFNITELILAFTGGIFGSAIGALPIWILCGLAVLIGAVISYMTNDPLFMTFVAWGSFLGPHTSFAGGSAAAAYAAKKGLLKNGRDICTALVGLNNPKVLLVGGMFGALGYILLYLIMLVPDYSDMAWTNHIAVAVILNMLLARVIFGKTGLLGKVKDGENRWIQTPEASWVIYQSAPLQIIILGLAIGFPASYFVQVMPNSDGIIFGFCTITLIFMQFGYKVPVTHHIALSATLATIATGEIMWGVSFGLLAAFFAELLACLFVNHGDTHIDPPTFALAAVFTLFQIIKNIGIFSSTSIFVWTTPILISLFIYGTLSFLRKPTLKLQQI